MSSRGNASREIETYFTAVNPAALKEQLDTFSVPEEVNNQRTVQFDETGTLNDEDDLVGLDEACGTLQDDDFKNNPEDEEDNNDETPSESAVATESTLFHDISGSLEGTSVTFFAGYAAFKLSRNLNVISSLLRSRDHPMQIKEI